MKRLLMASVMLAGSAMAAEAVPVRWQGEFMITGQTGVCDYDATGDFGGARFRPGIGGRDR
jgi:hypothetical protein